jgi:dolichol-phosphate mannosyltransferase
MIALKTSIIIPCFNEEEVIALTYERLNKVMVANAFADYELIFINDGSKDKTLELLQGFAQKDKNVKVLSFSRNFGHQAGVAAGINACSGEVAIIIDGDLQDPPELFPEMIKLHEKEKANVVYAVRKKRKGESWFKKISAKLFYRTLNWLSDVHLPVDTGDFRLIDRKVIDVFKSCKEKNKYIRGMISWMGFKQVPIFYDRDERQFGETKYTLKKMLKLASTAMFYFSKKPLKLALGVGFLSIMMAVALIIYVVVVHYTDPTAVLGWASTVITIVFFGGVQLLTVAILGEYIGSIFDEVKNRPEYIVEQKINI